MNYEKEIRNNFRRMGVPLAQRGIFGSETWNSLSQYSYTLESGFTSKEEAERHVIEYYSERMNLIRQ